MAEEVLKTYTKEQLLNFIIPPIVNKAGITAMNQGDAYYELLDALADLLETMGVDTVKYAKRLIDIALFTGMDFNKKPAQPARGLIRPYRIPTMTIVYGGVSVYARITNNLTTFSISTDQPGDNISVPIASYPTVQALCTFIDSHPSYSCSAIKGLENTSDLYLYTDRDIIGKIDYLNQPGCDIMLNTDIDINFIAPINFTANNYPGQTTNDYLLPSGESSIFNMAAESLATGDISIGSKSLDTINGIGNVSGSFPGIFWINDNDFTPGQEEETNEERKARWRTQIFGASKHNIFGIESAILNLDEVRSVKLLPSIPRRGYNTVVVDDGSGIISDSLRQEVQKVFDGDPNDPEMYPGVIIPGMTGFMQSPTIIGVNIDMTIYVIDPNVNTQDITNAVKNSIIQYVNRLRLGYDVIDSSLITIATNSHPSVFRAVLNSGATAIGDTEVARTDGTYGTVSINILETTP